MIEKYSIKHQIMNKTKDQKMKNGITQKYNIDSVVFITFLSAFRTFPIHHKNIISRHFMKTYDYFIKWK